MICPSVIFLGWLHLQFHQKRRKLSFHKWNALVYFDFSSQNAEMAHQTGRFVDRIDESTIRISFSLHLPENPILSYQFDVSTLSFFRVTPPWKILPYIFLFILFRNTLQRLHRDSTCQCFEIIFVYIGKLKLTVNIWICLMFCSWMVKWRISLITRPKKLFPCLHKYSRSAPPHTEIHRAITEKTYFLEIDHDIRSRCFE